MTFFFTTCPPTRTPPNSVITPNQTHSPNIIEIKTGQEDLSNCDGLWTQNLKAKFKLGVRTADCAPVVFHNTQKYGAIHAGWRGCTNGIIEKMSAIFTEPDTQIWVGPILPTFEIQKDFCYQELHAKFGVQFFKEKNNQIIFNFKNCLSHLLPTAQFDLRSTFKDPSLASWRRDKNQARNLTYIHPE